MLRHVVMFRWNDDVDEAHVAATGAALDRLVADISGAADIVDYRHGPDVGLTDGNFDYAIVGDFGSPETYAVYRDHPDHRTFIADFIAGRVAERAAVQHETS